MYLGMIQDNDPIGAVLSHNKFDPKVIPKVKIAKLYFLCKYWRQGTGTDSCKISIKIQFTRQVEITERTYKGVSKMTLTLENKFCYARLSLMYSVGLKKKKKFNGIAFYM